MVETQNRGTILLVDDLPDNLFVYSEILGRAGFDVITAGNGREALEKLQAHGDSIDLVLSDVMMPGIDGFDLCARIKRDQRFSCLPVVLITAQLLDDQSAVKGLAMGADDYISRPINPTLLVKKLEGFIARLRSPARQEGPSQGEGVGELKLQTQMLIHDLRSPLNSAMGFLSLLAMDPDLTEHQRELVITIQAAIQREMELIEDMLNMLAARDGRLDLFRERFDLVSTVREAVLLQRGNALRKEVELQFHAPEGILEVNADRKLISRVITNLLENAVKFSPSRASVEIWLFQDGKGGPGPLAGVEFPPEAVVFAISNQGDPIPHHAQERIFRPFEQVEKGARERSGVSGSGLGLAFCYEIVRLHRGTIGVVSPAPGLDQGALFYFALPDPVTGRGLPH